MKKLLSILLGIGIGAALGGALVLLFAPASGEKLIRLLREGYEDTLEEARLAAEARRRELEAELKMRRGEADKSIQRVG